MDYDEVTSFLGEWGAFQKAMFLLLSLSTVPNGYAGMAMVFLADTPDHHCQLPHLDTSWQQHNLSLSPSLPLEERAGGQWALGRCQRYRRANSTGTGFSNSTEGCLDGWHFDRKQYESTIVTEWSLVCGDSWKVPFSLSVFFMGVLSGSFVSGQISDRFGRKVTLFVTMAVQTVFSLVQVFSVSWVMFCILFYLVGLGQISNYVAAFVLGSELLGKSSRVTFSTLGVCVFYALGYAVLPLCAYFIRSWRVLLAVLSLPGLLYIPLWWLIPESPRWLLAQGRIEEAEAIVRAAARKNGVTAPALIFKDHELQGTNDHSHDVRYTYMDLVRTSKMRNVTFLHAVVWFIITISYFGLSLNTPNMNGDPYLNCFLSALVEIVAYVVAWLLLKLVPRRAVVTVPMLMGGLVLCLIHFVPQDYSVLSVVLAMAAKFGVTAALSVLYISAAETFPTVVRAMGIGICSMASKTGSTIAPFFPFLGVYDKTLPYIVMGLMTLVAGLLSILLPETRGMPLPQQVSEVQTLNWFCTKCKPPAEKKLPEEDGCL
ncbi:solute carrier family 22 member 4-like isoform X1 [Alosa pseudoharengus]|uniref:solute carrier family 22 member 4-like isoform X1 n=1 Tax=Alosa pseudoharengus TaxID=34774 RepID=UPI003F8C4C4E